MRHSFYKSLVVLLPLFLITSMAFATEEKKKDPFPSKESFFQALFEAGLPQVFEFKASASSFAVVREELNSRQETMIKKSSMDQYLQATKDWERVPALDYLVQSAMLGAVNIAGAKMGTKRYEAYKVGGFAICHKLEEGYIFRHFDGSNFHSCIAVPMDVNEVIERLELRGFLD